MEFDPDHIPTIRMSSWTPEGVMECVQEAYTGVDFAQKYGVGAVFRMQLDCSICCLLCTISDDGEEKGKLEIIKKAEAEATSMMEDNEVPVPSQVILRQIMADIYDAAEEAVRRWGE